MPLLLAVLMLAATAFAETANDPIVVKAGDTVIRLSEVQAQFDSEYEQALLTYQQYGMAVTQDEILTFRDNIVQYFVEKAVLMNKAAELGFNEVTEADIEEAGKGLAEWLDSTMALYAEQLGLTVEETKALFDENGLSYEGLIEQEIENIPQRRLYEEIIKDVVVSDEEIMKEYDAAVALDRETYENDVASFELYKNYYGAEPYYIPDGFRLVKHILLNFPEAIAAELSDLENEMNGLQAQIDELGRELLAKQNNEQPAEGQPAPREESVINAEIAEKQVAYEALEAQEKTVRDTIIPELQPVIDAINERLNAGEAFDALVAEYGQDPGMASTPEGYMVHAESLFWDTDFRDASVALVNKGDVSEPLVTGFGVHIIQYADDVAGGVVPITEELKAQFSENLLSSSQEAVYVQAISDWVSAANVEIHPELIVLPEIGPEDQGEAPAAEGEQTVG